MKIAKNHMLMTFVASLLLLSMLLTSMAFTFGQTTTLTRMNLTTTRNPTVIGVGQQVLLQSWLRPYLAVDVGGYRQTNYGFIYMITKPDGTFENVTLNTNDHSEAITSYTCTQLGTYSCKGYYPGDAKQASVTSTAVTWTVQQQATGLIVKADTYARLTVKYDLLGIGQTQYIDGWINPARESSRIYFDNTYTITKPSGQVITHVTDTHAEETSSFNLLMDENGTWSVTLSYGGDLLHNPCTSPVTYWTVQQNPISDYIAPQMPLPDYSWKFPISAEYQEWYQISGPWKELRGDGGRASFNPYSKGPESAHVLWKVPIVKGGIMGGDTGYMSWSGSFYTSSMGTTTVGAQGKIFYPWKGHSSNDTALGGTHWIINCMDEYTGKILWSKMLPGNVVTGIAGPMLYLDMSQQFKMDPNTHAAYNLWVWDGGLWELDPLDGDIIYYNSTIVTGTTPGAAGVYNQMIYMENWPLAGNITEWSMQSKAVVWTVQAPKNPLTGAYILPQTSSEWLFNNGMTYSVATVGENPTARKLYSWNLTDGSFIANGISVDSNFPSGGVNSIFMDNKIYGLGNDLYYYAGDVRNGQTVWKSNTPTVYPWGSFQAYQSAGAWGPMGGGGYQVYLPSWDGNLYCFNATNGNLLWKFFCGNTTETAMGHHMPWSEIITADNKVYFTVGEHTAPYPLPREGKFFCVDARTGELLWSLDGFYDHVWDSRAMAGIMGGIIWYPNRYDGCLWAFGKGNSATTVTATTVTVPLGTSVLLQGSVTDLSPGANGAAAVSDDSQNQWMGYLYENKPMPTNCTGVTVFLQAQLSNGTLLDIWHVQSDSLGKFAYTWTPPTQDTYKIVATFEGSNSYYKSSGECGLSVGAAAAVIPDADTIASQVVSQIPAQTPVVVPTPVSASDVANQVLAQMPSSTTTTLLIAAVAIAIIIGLVNLMMLRKRKQ